MISKIYSYDKPLFKVGERKGKSKKTIEKMIDDRLNTKKKKGKSSKLRIPKKKKNLERWLDQREKQIKSDRNW